MKVYLIFLMTAVLLLSLQSHATSCVGPKADFVIEDDFMVSKIEKAYRICGIQKYKTRVDEDGCVIYLKPKAKLLEDRFFSDKGFYPVAEKGDLCTKKSGDILKLAIKTIYGRCCGISEWTSWDVNVCKKERRTWKDSKCLWENARWEIAPEKK